MKTGAQDKEQISASYQETRQMPNALEAEHALIGILLHDNLCYEKVADFLIPEHFLDPLYKRIYRGIIGCINKGQLASPITLWPILSEDQEVKERGGKLYLENLENSVFSLSYAQDYGRQILEAHLRREMIRIASHMMETSYSPSLESDANSELEDAENKLFLVSSSLLSSKVISPISSLLPNVLKNAKIAASNDGNVIGVPTGLIDLDKHLGGLHASDLLILAGRPSMGKTALATNIAFSAAKLSGKSVAFFSLEMSSDQLATRILGQEAGISPDKIRKGTLTDHDLSELAAHAKKVARVPFFIDDTPALTVAGLRARAKRLYRQEKIQLIVIDYLQLIAGGNSWENRVQELSFITRSLKALAKELNIPILALSQLSRAVEQRDDKRPQLADLRESGSIEQDADVVMFIYREAYYEARKKPAEGSPKMSTWQDHMSKIHNVAELMIAKQRHGPIKNIMLYYQDSLTKFGNYFAEDNFIED